MVPDKIENAALITLNRIFGGKPEIGLKLISELGSASGVFRLDAEGLDTVFGPYSKYRIHINEMELEKSCREAEWLSSNGYRFVGVTDPEYPSALLECPDHPVGLYVRSRDKVSSVFGDRPMISIVGTRDLSPYGREWCQRIVRALSNTLLKPVIVSGLAIGADICAHISALECGLSTIAVMATGIDRVYPSRHSGWAAKIAASSGSSLVTDFPPATMPVAYNFLRRNRIIAGLSSSTILIESKAHGGGMMTANLSFGYGRNVYALPGRIDDLRSEGCNILIRKNIAEPIIDLDTFMEALGPGCFRKEKTTSAEEILKAKYAGIAGDDDIGKMTSIIKRIRMDRGITIEEISAAEDLPIQTAQALVRLLESDGMISIDLLQRCCMNVKIC